MIQMMQNPHEILVVDDAKSIRMMVHAVLADLDANFEYAENGLQALEMIREKQYDVIILDINMPLMSGLTVCEKVRTELKFKNLPILIMTNRHDYSTVETVFKTGATDFITKPLNEMELSSRVSRILEQRRTEKNLYIAQQGALRASEQKSQFLAVVSHELKTPLNAISGFSHLLLRSNLPEKEQRMLQMLVTASSQMKSMIDQLLEFDQIETHNKKVTIEAVDVTEVLDKCLSMSLPSIKEKALVIEQNVTAGLMLNTDRRLFSTLLSNLISNAIKYNKLQGQIRIDDSKNEKALQLTISDSGIGMTAAQVEKIYQPFSRFSTKAEGHGLGMAITKGITELLDIDIAISSEKDVGSSIRLKFTL